MRYRFANCTLDTQLHTLCRAGQSTVLSPKVFEVLCYLLTHRDRVVSKQELCDNVWQGLAISDATLESCIRTVRLSVGDSGQAQQIIQTQRGYGYRFMAAVETLAEASPNDTAALAAPSLLHLEVFTEAQVQTAPVLPSLRQEGMTALPGPGMQPCGVCARGNRDDAAFCTGCGTRLRQPCSYCGQNVVLPAGFCGACGQPLAPLAPPDLAPVATATPWLAAATSPPERQGGFSTQRKPVTVLCCTVATTVDDGTGIDLDVLHSLMQALYDLTRDVVQQYGGWLQPVMGDRLLITFGVPVVQEDHARRAVQVALSLRQRVHELPRRLGAAAEPALALRMGLHTGLVVESRWDDAASAVTVVGDVISLAVALQEQAEPGQILCSDATAHLVQEIVRLESIGPMQSAGQASPVLACAVLGSSLRRAPGGQPREARVRRPFVGREREMATLHALLAQVSTGRGQVVGVVGEAGIGKSRLIAEFSQSLEGRPLTYLTGRCLSYGSAMPYLPVLDLVRHYCDITETDSPEDITAKVHRRLQAVGMSLETWAPVFLPLLGVQEDTHQLAALSPEARKARLQTAFTQLCLNGSRPRPLVLEIEDLHWIDASSEECLAALVERMAGMPLLLLVTYRPGYRPGWIDKSYVTQVALHPLSSEESLRVVQAVLPTAGLSSAAVSDLLAKAGGNPFFLGELARMVVEQGLEAPASSVPDTVQAVLMARIDRLPPTAKRLLQAAAVIGKDIAPLLLQAVTEVSEDAMYNDLRSLQAAEFLYEIPPVYTFKHVLTQEVAYQSLVRGVRQQYHERIAQVLAAQFPEMAEAQPELLAQHYTEAHLPEQALSYWQRAGQHAVERSANVEAISHFTKGLEVLQSLPETPERVQHELTLQLALGPLIRMIKGHTAPEVEGVYTRAHELSQQVGDSQQQAAILTGLWRLYLNQARLLQARELAEEYLRLAQSMQDQGLLQQAHLLLGLTLFFQGQPVLARTHLEQGIALYDPQQDRSEAFRRGANPGVSCLSGLASTLWLLGYPDGAMTNIHAALTLAQESSNAYSLGFALNYASMLHAWRREVPLANERAEAMMTLSHEHGFIHTLSVGMIRRGWALAMQGAVAEGMTQLQQGLATWRDMGTALALPQHLALLADACRQGSQVVEGLHILAEALAHVDKTGERWPEAELYRLKGECLLAQIDKPCQGREAEECFRQALDIARHQQAKALELRAAMSLGRLWQQQGRRSEAHQLLVEIYGWFTEGFDTPDLQEAKALLEALQ